MAPESIQGPYSISEFSIRPYVRGKVLFCLGPEVALSHSQDTDNWLYIYIYIYISKLYK